MKKTIFILLIPFLLGLAINASGQIEPEEEVIITTPAKDSADLNTFYDELAKDGDWIKVDRNEIDNDDAFELSETVEIDDDIIVEYIWRPRISYVYVNWNPYTYGHWEWTCYGWVWVSHYPWGWGPYHYGRWWFSVRWGWVWSPGRIWAPSWVTWCHTRHHIGWHPISPRTKWRRHKGIIVTHPITPKQKSITNKWTFVSKEDFTKEINSQNVIDIQKNREIVNGAKISTSGNEVINTGPKRKDIENSTGSKISTKNVTFKNFDGETINKPIKSITPNEGVNNQKKNIENVSKNGYNTGDNEIKKNNESRYNSENNKKNPETNYEQQNKNTNKETYKNPNTSKESNKNTNNESNKNTNRETNKNTNKESNKNSNTNKETNKSPIYNPGNSNKNSSPQKETYKAPTHNPGNSNKETHKAPTHNPGNSNKETYKAPTHNPGNSNKETHKAPTHNPGNSNKNTSPPPKKNNS